MSHADWLDEWRAVRERYNDISKDSDARDFDKMLALESKLNGTVAPTGPDLVAQIDFITEELENCMLTEQR